MNMACGYLVWKQNGDAPKHVHPTFAEAKAEAERLALKESDEFFVLEIIAACRPAPKVVWEHYDLVEVKP